MVNEMTNERAKEIMKIWYLNGTEGMTDERLGYIEGWFNKEDKLAFELAIKALEGRPKGEWIKWNFKTFGAFGDWEYKCSNCEKVYDGKYNFCPNCGADMRGNENG